MLRGPRLFALVFLLAAGGALALFAITRGDDAPDYGPVRLSGKPDPFAYDRSREGEFTARATAGHSHVLYAKSPGGAPATARRVARWRPQIEAAAADARIDPDLLEAIVFLESAGDPNARASDDLEGAAGLTQILAGTARTLLGMRVDVPRSERLTRRIARRGADAHLLARRRRVDERFDPQKALEGTVRYLGIAKKRFGRDDLAVVSYHMGIGNLERVLSAYGDPDAGWAEVFFDATPRHHRRAYRLLAGFGDDSATYLWRVYAAREIMRRYREDPTGLRRLARLETAKASAEEVLHPPRSTRSFATPDRLADAYRSGDLRPFQGIPGVRADPQMGELARRLGVERRLYRGLRPEAFALAAYLAAGVRGLAGGGSALVATSSVRDERYQRLLARSNVFATRAYSLHTTGFAFDVRRDYASRSQAVAFQYMLDRLQSLNLIAWIREPDDIHITVSGGARALLPLLD